MGRMQRTKGAAFERLIAKKMREYFPEGKWRRSRQSDGAAFSDVHCHEGPDALRRLWLECNHANNPSPRAKWLQAIRDTALLDYKYTLAIVWRKTGSPAINVTMALHNLAKFTSFDPIGQILATISFEDFTKIIRSRL